MKALPTVTVSIAMAAIAFAGNFEEAEVTRVVKDVDLLHPEKPPWKALVGDDVRANMAVRTGNDSRVELQFPDRTIARLGANALFRFEAGSRTIDLEQGTILFAPPKGAGGGEVRMGAVTAAVSGTTWLGSHIPHREIKVIVLEGRVWILWKGFLFGRRSLGPGEMFHLTFGSPKPKVRIVRIDLGPLLASSRLLESGGFDPLPSMQLILAWLNRHRGPIHNPSNFPIDSVQTGQIVRHAIDVNKPPPIPQPPPAAKPPPTPPPLPSPPPPTPCYTS